jgi:hypothetical protein
MKRAKLNRRLDLLDSLLDYALRSNCKFAFCNGPEAPIRHMQTCARCACINRAIRMGFVRKVKQTYVRNAENGGAVVWEGAIEQFSSIDGRLV